MTAGKIITSKKFVGKDLTGKRFSNLTVVSFFAFSLSSFGILRPLWKCRCKCGSTAIVVGYYLNSGDTKSCGCLKFSRWFSLKYGPNANYKIRQLNQVWHGMKKRCLNPKATGYKRYGGRGIKVCKRWMDFSNFLDDMLPSWKPGLSIDRINNDGNYTPSNCRWANDCQQANNKSSSVLLTFQGKTQNMRQWSMSIGLADNTVSKRLRLGWSVEKSLTKPSIRPRKIIR